MPDSGSGVDGCFETRRQTFELLGRFYSSALEGVASSCSKLICSVHL